MDDEKKALIEGIRAVRKEYHLKQFESIVVRELVVRMAKEDPDFIPDLLASWDHEYDPERGVKDTQEQAQLIGLTLPDAAARDLEEGAGQCIRQWIEGLGKADEEAE